MKRTWYNFKAKTANTPTVLSIYDDIGAWGVSAGAFIKDLAAVSGPLDLEISSQGGSVFEGVAIYNALKRYAETAGNSVTVTVMGVAASIASVIAMAGAKIRMPANAYMMVHKPWGGAMGNADEMRDYAELLDKIENSLVGTYMARTGKTEDEIKAMLVKDTWMTADEAVAQGFADEVIDPVDVKASCDVDRLPDEIRALVAPADDEAAAAAKAAEEAAAAAKAAEEAAAAAKPFAEEAKAALDAAGLQDVSAVLVLACADLPEVKARIGIAREIKALCAVAKRDGDAKALIAANKSVADVRAHLIAALANEDERSEIDNTPNDKSPRGTQPAAVSTDSIWAARRKQQGA